MSVEMEKTPKPSLEDLLECSKIMSSSRGFIFVAPKNNLRTILDAAVGSTKFSKNLPVALLGVVGPKGSGKSFLTNFLLECLRAECKVGWMSGITKKGELTGRGFSWASISSPAFYKPDDIATTSSGVYLWPEPFLMSTDGNGRIVVWIMHLHSSGNDDHDENLKELEKFMALTCSRIIEIRPNNHDFRIVEHHRCMLSGSSSDPISPEDLCKSIVLINRSEAKATAGDMDEESKETLLNLLKDSGKNEYMYQKIVDNFDHISIIEMENSTEELHNANGILNKKVWRSMSKSITEIINTTMDASEIVQKIGADGGVTLGNMHDFLTSNVRKLFAQKVSEIEKTLDKTVKSHAAASSRRQRPHLTKSLNATARVQRCIAPMEPMAIDEMTETERLNKQLELQQQTNKIIEKMKTQYNEKVDDLLKKNQGGLDAKALYKHQKTIQTEVMKLLEMEIRSRIRSNETLENHKKALQTHIDIYWLTIVEENKKNLTTAEERKRRNTPLPPLVFHLQSSRIVMAMETDGNINILKNESGEEHTPAFVVLTAENTIVYGSAAHALIESPPTSGPEGLYWSVADYFSNHNFTWSKTICINANDYSITTEFLLAFLLRKLKQRAELQHNGRCDTAVLAIPFWLSSPQRIQVKDAAKIAGFSDVYLVNEASAAAYNFAISHQRSTAAAEVVVLSENFGLIDAFVYSYNGSTNKLKMLSHAGNYGNDKDKSRPTKALFLSGPFHHISTGCQYILNTLSQKYTEDVQRLDYIDNHIRELCKTVIERANSSLRQKIDPRDSLVICENSNKWEATLDNVISSFARKPNNINVKDAVLRGAVILSRNPKEIGEFVRDKPAHDVLQASWFGVLQVVSKDDLLKPNSKIHNASLKPGLKQTSFHQMTMGTKHDIGRLVVKVVSDKESVDVNLEITNEAIVKLRHVAVHSNLENLLSSTRSRERLPDGRFQWSTSNLSEERLTELASLLESVTEPLTLKKDPSLSLIQAKTLLLQKCLAASEKIDGGQFLIKSSLVRDRMLERISEARVYAEHGNTSLKDVEKQMEALGALCEKYERK